MTARRSRGRAPTIAREEITMAQAMKWLAISRKQVEREIEAGMPAEKREGRVIIFWPDARVWRDEQIREKERQAKPLGGPKAAHEARNRKAEAEADLAEIEVAKARRELVPVAEAEGWFEAACARIRGKLLSLPPRLATAGVGHQSPRDAQAALQPIVYEVMEELHRGDDVPIMDTDDGQHGDDAEEGDGPDRG